MQNVIQDFIQGVFKRAGLDNLPPDFKQEYQEKLAAEAERRLGLVAISELDAKGVQEFEDFMTKNESPTPDAMLEFFTNHIPDFQNKVVKALQEFADEFVKGVDDLKGIKLT